MHGVQYDALVHRAGWSQNATFFDGSVINVTGLAGSPPAQTSGTPSGIQGAGGGYGGRGATCVSDNNKLPDDVWGGDAYSWATLDEPWSYGNVSGDLLAIKGGGGSGGSIYIKAHRMTGTGTISATGGGGFAGGGGGRISIHVFSRHDNTDFFIHGGVSLGCAGNAASPLYEN
ncbi:hypothetical protein P8452_18290 [Trifolium repens]|nr:hypothetical protein P8452_18290 [Trifolium repens]